MAEKKVHEGRNIKRFREMMGIKQDALAWELGEDWNQQKISLLEQRERVDEPILRRIAEVLKIPVEALKTFDEEQVINVITNNTNYDNASPISGATVNNYPVYFNPLEKWIEALEKIEHLHEEVVRVKDEQIALLREIAGK
ncbi:MAG: helix-turn-helix domain-containing protein [Flavobacteriales bacterium]